MLINKNGYPLARGQKYCLWLNMPSHHQNDFIKALHNAGIDLLVRYFGAVDDRRRIMGWDTEPELDCKSAYFKDSIELIEESIPDWRDRIHIVPGTVGNRFLMGLVDHLILEKVYWVHWSESTKPGLPRIVRFPFRIAYGHKITKHALGAFAISKLTEQEFSDWGISYRKIMWLPYAVNPLIPEESIDSKLKEFINDRFVFMFVGSLCQRKGTDILLKSFKRIAARYSDVVLILLGPDTENQRYENEAKKLDITDKVLFKGVVKFDQIKAMVQLCDVFILPSRHDGWGMVIFEAASLGKAIIATDRCGAAHHIISDGLNGYRIKGGKVASLTQAMERYLENPGMAMMHGENSKLMAKLFYPNRNVDRFLCAMESFLNN